jgi:hypothetical protein
VRDVPVRPMDENGVEPRDDDPRQILLDMAAADQALRTELAADGSLFGGYHPRMAALQRQHAQRLLAILETQGWPAMRDVGEDGADAAWVIVQHAIGSPAVMRRGLTFLTEAAERGEAAWWRVAQLDDRIRVLEGRLQRYGTQHDWDERGELSPQPIDDAAGVDDRRAAVGLEPLADQTRRLRAVAACEGEQPPAGLHAYHVAFRAWARDTGWRD